MTKIEILKFYKTPSNIYNTHLGCVWLIEKWGIKYNNSCCTMFDAKIHCGIKQNGVHGPDKSSNFCHLLNHGTTFCHMHNYIFSLLSLFSLSPIFSPLLSHLSFPPISPSLSLYIYIYISLSLLLIVIVINIYKYHHKFHIIMLAIVYQLSYNTKSLLLLLCDALFFHVSYSFPDQTALKIYILVLKKIEIFFLHICLKHYKNLDHKNLTFYYKV